MHRNTRVNFLRNRWVSLLRNTQQREALDEDMHWWVACERADRLVDAFGFSSSEKQNFILALQQRFHNENSPVQTFRKELNTRYRSWQNRIANQHLSDVQSLEVWRPLIKRIRDLYQQPNASLPPHTELVQSLLHMLLNRFFISN